MTTYNKNTLKTFFAQGDIPQGSDFANLIDSQINMVETAEQSLSGPLTIPGVTTPRISAATANFTATVSAVSINIAGIVSAQGLNATGIVSALGVSVSMDVSADGGSIHGSAGSFQNELLRSVTIISAAGTTQATAAVLTASINRLKGVTDGSQTGCILLSNRVGNTQYIINETAASANLYPAVGGQINSLTVNSPFGMTAATMYTIVHTLASAYWVK